MSEKITMDVKKSIVVDELNSAYLSNLLPRGFVLKDIRTISNGEWRLYLVKKRYPKKKEGVKKV
jgi:hypothetical protein